MAVTLIGKIPDRCRYGMEYRGTEAGEAYDGDDAWHMNPFDGINSPMPVKNGVQASKIKSEADIVSPLVDWKAEGCKVVHLGKKRKGHLEWLQLKVALKDGYAVDYFLDSGNCLPAGFIRLECQSPGADPNAAQTSAIIAGYRMYSFLTDLRLKKAQKK